MLDKDVDLEILKAYLIENGQMAKDLILTMISQVKQMCVKEPNIITVEGDVVIIGDIHGQFMDMMGMFAKLKR